VIWHSKAQSSKAWEQVDPAAERAVAREAAELLFKQVEQVEMEELEGTSLQKQAATSVALVYWSWKGREGSVACWWSGPNDGRTYGTKRDDLDDLGTVLSTSSRELSTRLNIQLSELLMLDQVKAHGGDVRDSSLSVDQSQSGQDRSDNGEPHFRCFESGVIGTKVNEGGLKCISIER
jgi:hypothetical protein